VAVTGLLVAAERSGALVRHAVEAHGAGADLLADPVALSTEPVEASRQDG
jgi:hypothetical protein